MVAEESDGSMQWFHFFDGIFLGQWYPEGFHAKSMVLKRFTPFITPSTAVSPCFTPPRPAVIVALPPHAGMYSYSFGSIVWCSIIRRGNMFPSYATYLTRERTVSGAVSRDHTSIIYRLRVRLGQPSIVLYGAGHLKLTRWV